MTDIAISDLRAVRTASAVLNGLARTAHWVAPPLFADRFGPSVLQVGPHQVDWISVAVAGRRIPVRGRVQAARLRPSFRFPCARVDRLRRRCGGDRAAHAARDRTVQLVVPDGWQNFHLPWAALATAIIALGPGPVSIDHALARFFSK